MKRPALVVIVDVMQMLLGLMMAGTVVYLITLTRSRDTLAEADAVEVVHGLLIGALVIGIPAIITLIAAVGLWKGKFWGWVLSLATDVGVVAVMVYSMVGDNDVDTEQIALTAGFLVAAVLLLLPAVRTAYWRAATPQGSMS